MTFWILEWESAHGDAGEEYGPVAALLPGDWPVERVAEHVRTLHDTRMYDQDELFAFTTGKHANPYPPKVEKGPHGSFVTCGHEPFLSALRGKNVRVQDGAIKYDFAE